MPCDVSAGRIWAIQTTTTTPVTLLYWKKGDLCGGGVSLS
jgi:hypothetical protein